MKKCCLEAINQLKFQLWQVQGTLACANAASCCGVHGGTGTALAKGVAGVTWIWAHVGLGMGMRSIHGVFLMDSYSCIYLWPCILV